MGGGKKKTQIMQEYKGRDWNEESKIGRARTRNHQKYKKGRTKTKDRRGATCEKKKKSKKRKNGENLDSHKGTEKVG